MIANLNSPVVGGDPGGHGAVVYIDELRRVSWIYFTKGCVAVHAFLEYLPTCPALMEGVHAIRGDFTPQLATFMTNKGKMIACLQIAGFVIDYIDAKAWQLEYGLGGKHGPPGCTKAAEKAARKRAHKAKAQELFPELVVTLDLADALLIAEYQWRESNGVLTNGKDSSKIARQATGIQWGTRRKA